MTRWWALLGAAATVAVALLLVPRPSERERIEHAIRSAAAAFDERDVESCVAVLHDDFRDETDGLDRRRLREVLRFVFLRQLGPEPRHGGLTLAIAALDVAVAEPTAGARATVDLVVAEGGEPAWGLRVDAELARGEDGEWRVRRSRYETTSGRRPR